MDSLFFDSFTGNVAQTEITFEPIRQTDLINFKNFEGSFTLPDLEMIFKFHNEIDLDISIEMNITGYHRDNISNMITDSVKLNISKVLERGQAENCCSIILKKETSSPSIVDLISIMPNELKVEGKATVGGEGQVNKGAKIWLDYSIDSPFSIRIDEALVYTGDKTQMDELKQKRKDQIRDNLTEVSVTLITENSLPLDTDFKFYISTDSTDLYNEEITNASEKIILQSSIDAGKTDNNGFVEKPSEGSHTIQLTNEQLTLFESPDVFYGIKFSVGEVAEAVRFRPSDGLRFDTVLKFDVVMNNEN